MGKGNKPNQEFPLQKRPWFTGSSHMISLSIWIFHQKRKKHKDYPLSFDFTLVRAVYCSFSLWKNEKELTYTDLVQRPEK